ncbi:hypothetical protein [Catellatospora citrea]|uniref:Uncharacterized protein n=1 Tax=Catellatospora citrea TaxID=53366 RepID=A0A8J3NXB7_9ACTN|nr:hypothetical protein [Catellatospora citrea]RKE12617.1 hypothetical protein C8E86_7559 [Catellatospora citrea]GIF96147.1 hypothetical protein Cci01nite_12410 [Catellatospora citrea]
MNEPRPPVEGTWELAILTPLGRQHTVLTLTRRDGRLTGTMRDVRHGEQVDLVELEQHGARLTWAQSITRPMRLNLAFDVTVDGAAMSGQAKAGRLPASRVTGQRATPAGG